MPYARTSELPSAVKNALPALAQRVFMHAFNSEQKRGLSEERSFQAAWGAVKNAGWSRGDDGKWVKKAVDTEEGGEVLKQPDMADVHVDTPMGGKKKKKKPEEGDHSSSCAMSFEITKTDEEQRLVFGWLSVIEEDGKQVVDLQGHVIDEAELENAAYDFVLHSRVGGEMHRREAGQLVEAMVFTKDKQEALGIDLGKVGLWVGFKLDEEAWPKVKDGTYRAFSLGGRGQLEDVAEAA